MKTILFYVSLFISSLSFAEMTTLDDLELGGIDGQAGADLKILLSLNHDSQNKLDTTLCSDLRYCRLGIALNNRTVNVTVSNGKEIHSSRGDNLGRKQWVVMKGIQGTVDIQKLMMDGSTLTWTNSGLTIVQPTVMFGFDPTKPIKIRNLGFESISVETDTVANEGAGNIPGYLVSANPPASHLLPSNKFDENREKGFLGLKINTNLSLTGNIKVFACGSNHPRC